MRIDIGLPEILEAAKRTPELVVVVPLPEPIEVGGCQFSEDMNSLLDRFKIFGLPELGQPTNPINIPIKEIVRF